MLKPCICSYMLMFEQTHVFFFLFDIAKFAMMQVLNGLLSRSDQKEAISIPIGIIPAGSDNSLVWTVLGVRDPISAAIAIVKVTTV